MDLHDRVKEILDGRIKMGAGAPKKRKPRKRAPVLKQVPPMYEVPNSSRGQMTTALASQYVGQNPKITDDMLKHHYPVDAETLGTDPHDPELMKLLHDLIDHKEPSVREAGVRIAGRLNMPLVGYGTNGKYAQNVRAGVRMAGRQVSKNYGGQRKCRKGCKHMRCAMAKAKKQETERSSASRMCEASQRSSVTGGKKRCPKGCHCTKCKSAKGGKKYPYEGRMRDHRWIDFVKEFAKLNKMSYKDAMKAAAPYYQDRSPLDKKGGVDLSEQAKAMHIGRVKVGAAKKKKAKRVHRKSEWIDYVKEFAKLNKISYKEALMQAGPSYHAQA